MFIGHFATALAAKRLTPGLSLGATFLACQLLDLVWPALVLVGVETVSVDPAATAFTPLDFEHYPWSHSLVAALAWSALASLVALALRRTRREALVVGALVAGHWLLDFFSHRPDLPLAPGGDKVGLGLWHSVPATLAVEVAMFAAGLWIYVRSGGPPRRVAGWALFAFLAAIYLLNAFGPTPPIDTAPAALAGPALALWILVGWAWWADRAGASAR